MICYSIWRIIHGFFSSLSLIFPILCIFSFSLSHRPFLQFPVFIIILHVSYNIFFYLFFPRPDWVSFNSVGLLLSSLLGFGMCLCPEYFFILILSLLFVLITWACIFFASGPHKRIHHFFLFFHIFISSFLNL